MFSLVIVIIGIALVVALIAATNYYGGDSYKQSQLHAKAATAVNQMEQVAGAMELRHASEGKRPLENLEELVPQYLSHIPKDWTLSPEEQPVLQDYAVQRLPVPEDQQETVCELVNKKKGHDGPPPSCDALPERFSGCCVVTD